MLLESASVSSGAVSNVPDRMVCGIQTTEMRVVMCCNKCEEKVREEIGEVYGE